MIQRFINKIFLARSQESLIFVKGGIDHVMLFKERAIINLDITDSTNQYANHLLRTSPPPDGTVITAQSQHQGRGQRGTAWESRTGENLLCSMIVYPNFLTSKNHFFLSKIVALALQELLEEKLDREVLLKWPNDIIVAHKKIAGILIESSWNDQRLQSAVIGVGINLNQMEFDAPKATSTALISGDQWNEQECLQMLLVKFEKFYFKLATGHFAEISKLYRDHLYRLGQPMKFEYQGKEIEAMITGVDDDGRLQLHCGNGESLSCGLKEIKMWY
jgi:BirA family transcriptional regulator, biotin operon repressor / biotin---[acetyl-CoA-carboxylase] ligase